MGKEGRHKEPTHNEATKGKLFSGNLSNQYESGSKLLSVPPKTTKSEPQEVEPPDTQTITDLVNKVLKQT